jgi:hypothetical protein
MDSLFQLFDLLLAPLQWMPIGNWNNPSQVVLIVMLFATFGTIVLMRQLSGIKTVTAPICFWVLCFCGMATNRVLNQFHLPGTNEMQSIMIYSTIGVAVGSLALLATLRVAARGER